MTLNKSIRILRIVVGIIIGALAIYANFMGEVFPESATQLIIFSIFALMLMDTPKEE